MDTYKYWFVEGAFDSSSHFLYFFGGNVKGFFRMNLKDNKVTLLKSLSDVDFSYEMYGKGIVVDGKVYFPPRNTLKLAIYDIKSDELRFYDIYSEKQIAEWGIASSIVGYHILQKDKFLYFIFRDRAVCVKYNIENNSLTHIVYNNAEEMVLAVDFEALSDVYYFPLVSANGMLVFDIEKEEFQKYSFTNENFAYNSILRQNDNMLLIPIKGNQILIWDTVNKKESSIVIEGFKTDYGYCYNAVLKDTCTMLIPLMDVYGDNDDIIVLDENFKIIDKKKIFKQYVDYKKWRIFKIGDDICYIFYKNNNKYLTQNGKYVHINLKTLTTIEVDIPLWCGCENINQEILMSMKKYIDTNYLIEESAFSIKEYMQLIDIKNNSDKHNQKIGENIHNKVLEI